MRLANLTDERLAEMSKVSRYGNFPDVADAVEELIDRRAEEQSEFRNTERGLAFIQASSLLDCNCGLIEGKSDWFDISDYPEDLSGEIDEAIEYLEARGLLEHDPANYNHCSIRNESEATA